MTDVLLLMRRQLAADRWPAVLLALVVLLTVALSGAALRFVDRATADDVRAAVARMRPVDRDLVGRGAFVADPRFPDVLPPAAREATAGLSGVTGDPVWTLRIGSFTAPGPGGVIDNLTVRIGSGWTDHVRLVAGRLPSGAEVAAPVGAAGGDRKPPVVVDVALVRRVAAALGLGLGRTVDLTPQSSYAGAPLRLRVVGLLDADAADPFWSDDLSAVRAVTVTGPSFTTTTAAVFAATEALPVLAESVFSPNQLIVRVPVLTAQAQRRPAAALADDLGRVVAQQVDVSDSAGGVRLTSGLVEVLRQEITRRAPLEAVTAVLVAVLLAAALGALLLAARLLVRRRAPALALARARGAAGAQLLTLLALEGLLLGVPAAVVGSFVAGAVPDGGVPGGVGAARRLLPLVVALAPAVALAGSALPQVRGAAVPRTGAARRLAARHGWGAALVLLVVLAALAAVALRGRGLAPAASPDAAASPSGAAAAGTDGFVVLAPVLVAAAVAVLVARGVRPVLQLVTGLTARRRGGVAFLGLARAGRERTVTGVALVALALTVTAAVLAAVAAVTVQQGTAVAAARATAADLRVQSAGFGTADAVTLAGLPGVAAVAPWSDPQDTEVVRQAGDRADAVTMIGTDPLALADVQRTLEGVPRFPESAARSLAAAPAPADRLPVVVSEGLATPGAELRLRVADRPLTAVVVAAVAPFAGAPDDGAFLVADVARLRALTALPLAPQLLLARASGPLPDEATIRAALPATSAVSSRASTAEQATSLPMARAIRAGLPIALGVGALYAVLTVVLALLLGSRERGRFLAHLRALGLSARQSAAVVGVEAVPPALAGLLSGLVAGLLLTWLVLPAADLRPLTGSALPQPPVVRAGTVLAVAGAFVVVLAVAVLLAVAAGRRVSPVDAARTVEAG